MMRGIKPLVLVDSWYRITTSLPANHIISNLQDQHGRGQEANSRGMPERLRRLASE